MSLKTSRKRSSHDSHLCTRVRFALVLVPVLRLQAAAAVAAVVALSRPHCGCLVLAQRASGLLAAEPPPAGVDVARGDDRHIWLEPAGLLTRIAVVLLTVVIGSGAWFGPLQRHREGVSDCCGHLRMPAVFRAWIAWHASSAGLPWSWRCLRCLGTRGSRRLFSGRCRWLQPGSVVRWLGLTRVEANHASRRYRLSKDPCERDIAHHNGGGQWGTNHFVNEQCAGLNQVEGLFVLTGAVCCCWARA